MGNKRKKRVKPMKHPSRTLNQESRLRTTEKIIPASCTSGLLALVRKKSDIHSCLSNSKLFELPLCGNTESTFPVIQQKTGLPRQLPLHQLTGSHNRHRLPFDFSGQQGTHCRIFPRQSIVARCHTTPCWFYYSAQSSFRQDFFSLGTIRSRRKAWIGGSLFSSLCLLDSRY